MSDTTNLGTAFVPAHVQDSALTYEQKLEQNLRWAMDEGSRHFEEKSAVHATLRRICKRLKEMEIPYAVVVEWLYSNTATGDLPKALISW